MRSDTDNISGNHPSPIRDWRFTAPSALMAAALVWGALAIHGHYPIVDEKAHLAQIEMFRKGDFRLYVKHGEKYPRNAMYPGFHAMMAGTAKILGVDGKNAIRTLCLAFAAAIAILAFTIARELTGPDTAALKAAQVFFLPVLFPFHFLIYTDAAGTAAILAAFLATLKKKDALGGALALAAVFIRHNNVVFVGFILAYRIVDEFGWNPLKTPPKRLAATLWPYAAVMTLVAAGVVINGRPALDDPSSHVPTLSLVNPLLALFCCGALFAPVLLAGQRGTSKWISKHQKAAATILTLVCAASAFLAPTHPWNTLPWLWHNEILAWLFHDGAGRTVLAATASFAALSLAALPLTTNASKLVWVFGFLALAPVALIEPRYYILPLALLTLIRKPRTTWAETTQLALLVLLAIAGHLSQVYTARVI